VKRERRWWIFQHPAKEGLINSEFQMAISQIPCVLRAD
jgi:hypothetical protein